MIKNNYIWLNQRFVQEKMATIPILTHGLHYGSAIFEGIRFYETKNGPAIFRLDEHLERFFFSAKALGMKIIYSKQELKKAIIELVKKNKLKSGYIRPIAFYGEKMGLNPNGVEVQVGIACWAWGKYLEKETVRVKISPFMRLHPRCSVMGAKISGHYFNSILASIDAKKSGFDEALLLDWQNNIAEGPGENIFFVKEKKIFTPSGGAILSGITRDSIMKIAKDLGYQVLEKKIKVSDLKSFAEAFFTGTAVEVNAISQIGKINFGNGKEGEHVARIKKAYQEVIFGQNKKYQKWLTFVK